MRPRHVLLAMVPPALARRFDPRAATDLDATLELRIRDPHRQPPDCFTVLIRDGRCQVSRGPAAAAQATATLGAGDLIRMAIGDAGWPELFAAGRLALGGDPYLALRLPSLFGLPVRGRARAGAAR